MIELQIELQKKELNRFYKSYCLCLKRAGRAPSDLIRTEWIHNAKLHAKRYNQTLKILGGPEVVKGEFYLSLGGE